jgi:hypothetical protein
MTKRQCKHETNVSWRWGWRRCQRAATKDGYCTRHHPDYLSPHDRKVLAEMQQEDAK